MIYKNKRTGNVIEVSCEIAGEDWEIAKESPKTAKKKAVKEVARTVRNNR